jgi:copper chaperone CopZ
MIHTYQLTGMTCTSCEAKVKSSLLTLPDVTSVDVSKDQQTATISMDKHIPLSDLQKALGGEGSKYQIIPIHHSEAAEQAKSWFATYKPLLIVFSYITIVTVSIQLAQGHFDVMHWMQHFMAGFFLTFSFFKMLDLTGFADSYSMYDIIAKRFKGWGFMYAFIELGLGLAYAVNFYPFITNVTTVIVMGISTIGVLQSVWKKQKIQCACLGAVFNLPMSTVTIIEDLLMVAMAGITLITI